MFQPILERKALSEVVEDEITDAIRRGKYIPGNKIPTENELCSIFNISRTAVREAIKKLSAKGIVQVKKGSGIYVSEISIANAVEGLNMFFGLSTEKDLILNTIDTRRLVEPSIAAEAAKGRTSYHIQQLEKNMEKMRKCSIGNIQEEAELDNEFHRNILDVVENTVLQLLIIPIFNLMPKFKTDVFAKSVHEDNTSDKELMLGYHQNILKAIIDQDPGKAKAEMEAHLLETRNNYLKSISHE